MKKKQRYFVFIFVAENSLVKVGTFQKKLTANTMVKRLLDDAIIGAGDRVNIAIWDSTKSWDLKEAWDNQFEQA